MNYIEIINNYWSLREQGILDRNAGDLYLYLIHKSNTLGWKNPFNQSNALICGFLGITEKTLIANRNKLKQEGLIEFSSGKKGSNTEYFISPVRKGGSNSSESYRESYREKDSHTGRESYSLAGGFAPDNNKHKLNETKLPVSAPASYQPEVNAGGPPPVAPPPSRQEYLVPAMHQVWKELNPRYPEDAGRDYEPLQELARFIAGHRKIAYDPGNERTVQTLLDSWKKVAAFVADHEFFRTYSLQQVEKHIQTIIQSMRNGKSAKTEKQGLQPGGVAIPKGERSYGKL